VNGAARSLAARIALAFVALSLAVLVGTGGALFVALRSLHTEAQDARLTDLADGLAGATRQALADGARPREVLETLRDAVPDGVSVAFRTAEGRLVRLDDAGPVGPIDVAEGSATGSISHGSAVDAAGRPLRYALISIRVAATPNARAVIVSAPDVAADLAARDVARTLPVVLLVLLLVGVPIGWLLWRSVARPLRVLSDATARVPAGIPPPLPLDGPTEVRELTGHFNAMTAELERRRREEADLLQNLRHDLRTPLTVIGGFAQALGDGTATGPDATRAATAISEEADRLGRMLEELDTADDVAAGSLHPEVLDGADVVEGAVARFAAAAEAAGISLTASAGPRPLPFVADRVAIERILANLVENALAAVRPGGSIVVSARSEDPPAPARRGRRPRTPWVPGIILSVADDGPGFPPGTRDRVFERFYRADPARSGGGSGLGLSIVRELARAHGGDAWAEDVAPHGGRVLVRLPSVPTSAPVLPGAGTVPAGAAEGGGGGTPEAPTTREAEAP
jgi:signal transduction histidine kinase